MEQILLIPCLFTLYINTVCTRALLERNWYDFSRLFSPVVAVSRPLGWLKYIEIACSRLLVPSSAGCPCCCITTPAVLVEQGLAGYGIGAKAVSAYVGETKPHPFSPREGTPEL